MARDILAALCLVLVIEGLFLFALPAGWKRLAAQLQELAPQQLRVYGIVMAGIGLLLLQWVR